VIEARVNPSQALHDLEDDLLAAVLEDPAETGDV
jgi:hypothetical protein